MGIVESLIEDIKKTIQDTLKDTIREIVRDETADKWLSKQQLAEYWGVSTKWIELRMDEIPHSATTPWSFKRSLVDQWRMGELKQTEIIDNNKVSIRSYKSNNFKVGTK